MQDKDFLIENYQERFWQYQNKELQRAYERLMIKAIKIGVSTGIFTGIVVAILLFIVTR